MDDHNGHSHLYYHRHRRGVHHGHQSTNPPRDVEAPVDMEQPNTTFERDGLLKLPSRLLRRQDCSGSNADSNLCQKPVSSSQVTLPISICSGIALVVIICVLYYFNRKTKQRHAKEDTDQKYRSLDFGLGDARGAGKDGKKRKSLFGEKGLSASHSKGMSMDMNLESPYLLPPGVEGSRESLVSLARSMTKEGDPYSPSVAVGQYNGSEIGSMRSFPKDRGSSIYTAHTNPTHDHGSPTSRTQSIISNGGHPPRQGSLGPDALPKMPPPARSPRQSDFAETQSPTTGPANNGFNFTDNAPGPEHVDMPPMPPIQEPAPVANPQAPQRGMTASPLQEPEPSSFIGGLVRDRDSSALPMEDMSGRIPQDLGAVDPTTGQPLNRQSPPPEGALPAVPGQPQPAGGAPGQRESDLPSEYNDYADHFQLNVQDEEEEEQRGRQMNDQFEHPQQAGLGVPQHANKRISVVGDVPLPPEELLEDGGAESRADRIRSFYKEYFDDSKEPRPPMPQPQAAQYYEDYDAGLGDTPYYDPDTNTFVMPYAQPVTRRAMTPPPSGRRPMPSRPRGPGGPGGPRGPPGPGHRPRAGSTMSGGRFGMASPRPGSSASARIRGPSRMKKPLPPPAALTTLPTPSKLKDDSMAILGAIDFAPPPSFADTAAGRSQSPLGERRPYQPKVPVATPLLSAYDDMVALPSPHMMRKSGTFTGLDFAPPPRFKDNGTMSDAGSIRSVGSGISAVGKSAVRQGAGRVSRLPGDQVFTAAAEKNMLKPQWGMRD